MLCHFGGKVKLSKRQNVLLFDQLLKHKFSSNVAYCKSTAPHENSEAAINVSEAVDLRAAAVLQYSSVNKTFLCKLVSEFLVLYLSPEWLK